MPSPRDFFKHRPLVPLSHPQRTSRPPIGTSHHRTPSVSNTSYSPTPHTGTPDQARNIATSSPSPERVRLRPGTVTPGPGVARSGGSFGPPNCWTRRRRVPPLHLVPSRASICLHPAMAVPGPGLAAHSGTGSDRVVERDGSLSLPLKFGPHAGGSVSPARCLPQSQHSARFFGECEEDV